ncbi:winged helix-turn-helix domain-containing protein [Tianweitania sediminis]|uniref:YcaQ family DNA glycosylase n=1 Tax=Tianweitania sediminis TaxID=1502156 RepID=A0A8J7R1N7_9HYPH|nr:crosslink repair DNA glycosylase YcaQ family protein [Tianweitania sediminis]MBP0439063.1 YcaQ family DNA glycosylase [Tianweitania sediminis]
MSHVIPNAVARRLLIHEQALSDPPHRAQSLPELGDVITRLGYVQVDSIAIVERAHHQILFARNKTYKQPQLHRLIERERALFEHWTHDASVIPVAFYPYWKHRFAREKLRLAERWPTYFGNDFAHSADAILERIRRDGPVMARDFEARDKPSTGWWDWHPSKAALEYLWRTGELQIARREGFQKVYDLTERVIAAQYRDQTVDHDAFVDWACTAALTRLGFGTRGQIAAFFALLKPAEVEQWIAAKHHRLVVVQVESSDGSKPRAAYAFPEIIETLDALPEPPARVRVLSPFDPLLRDRARAERVFDFHYRIEVFVPEAKRKFGYYVFPVMRGDRIIGRIDMKADRPNNVMSVRRFWPERGCRLSKAVISGLEAEIERLRRFTGVERTAFASDWLEP